MSDSFLFGSKCYCNYMKTKFLEKELLFGIIAVIFGLVAVSTFFWTLSKYPTEKTCNEKYALNEIPVFGIIYLKPMTLIVYSVFISWMCGLESLRTYISKLPIILITLVFLFLCFAAFASSYEVIWNFFVWSDAYLVGGGNTHMDLLYHLPTQTSPTAQCPSNFVYTTKLQFLIMSSSFYGIYFFHRILKSVDRQKKLR